MDTYSMRVDLKFYEQNKMWKEEGGRGLRLLKSPKKNMAIF